VRKRICFFAKVADEEVLRRVEFYAQDLRILEDLGCEVCVATRPYWIPSADVYFVWWWTWAFAPLLWAMLRRRRVIITGVFDLWAFDRRTWIHQWLLRFALRNASANVFVSEMETREVPGRFRVTSPVFIPLTVDTERYSPGGIAREGGILSIGWLNAGNAERKGFPDIIRAAPLIRQRHPGVRIRLVGERGAGFEALQRLAQEVGVTDFVEFPGLVSASEKISLMQQCALYLQPSRFEGFGLAILEAMSCGAPVVTCPSGAVSEVVGDAACLVEPGSPEAIARAVNGLLEDAGKREELGRRARERAVTVYPYERRKRELAALLERLTGTS
jgi:glycosyltransferase involved in cell wall biosynthesis